MRTLDILILFVSIVLGALATYGLFVLVSKLLSALRRNKGTLASQRENQTAAGTQQVQNASHKQHSTPLPSEAGENKSSFADDLSYFPDEGQRIEYLTLSKMLFDHYIKPRVFSNELSNKYNIKM